MKKYTFFFGLALSLFLYGCMKKESFLPPPEAPSNLQVITNGTNDFTLTWTDNSQHEEGFEIQVKLGSNNYTIWNRTLSNVTNYHLSGLIPGTIYKYRLIAYNVNSNSSASNEVICSP